MLLNELDLSTARKIKQTDWFNSYKVVDWLKENGFKKIGEGNYSGAYVKSNSNIVVMVNIHLDEIKQQFIQYCKQNKSNPHLPKFGKILKINNNFVIFTEKLIKISDEEYYSSDIPEFIIKNIPSEKLLSYLPSKMKHVSKKQILLKSNQFRIDHKLLAKTIIDINKKFHVKLDLHSGNFMKRGSTIVINDI